MRKNVKITFKPSKVYLSAVCLIFCFIELWSLATPLFAGPDEPVQVIKSYAVDHGQLLGQLDTQPGQQEFALVNVPGFYSVDRAIPKCFDHHSAVPASCAPPPSTTCYHPVGSTAPPCGVAFIYNARYPPLYYLIIGIVSFLPPGKAVLYLMRALSALIEAAFLALAITCALCYSSRPLIVLGVVVAMTPMVIYLGGIVNPASLEISTGLATWTTGIILATDRRCKNRRTLLISLGISASIMALSRPISPFWLALIAVFVILAGAKDTVISLMKRRDFQIVAGVIFFFALLATIWILKEHATDVLSTSRVPASVSLINILEESFHHNVYYIPTMIGVFGTFDTYAPALVYLLYYAMIAVMFILAFVVGDKKDKFLLAALLLLIICIPVAISSSQAHLYGYTWNGKDTLPFAVGLPVLSAEVLFRHFFRSATVAADSDTASPDTLLSEVPVDGEEAVSGAMVRRSTPTPAFWRRLSVMFLVMIALGQFLAFYEAIRRYAAGTGGPVFSFLHSSPWDAPLGNASLVGLFFLLSCVFVLLGTATIRGLLADETI